MNRHYGTVTPLNTFGSHVRFPALGAPPGTSLSPQVAELLRDIAEQLGLASKGIATPWAGARGDTEWVEINNPDTNIQTFGLRNSDLVRAQRDLLFGSLLPFIVIVTPSPVPQTQLSLVLDDSPYEFFETQGVYRQDDPNPIPRIHFFHWVRRRDEVESGSKSMDVVAQQLEGNLLFAQQVPVEGTTTREKPVVDFETALEMQFNVPSPPGPPPRVVPVPAPLPEFPEIPGFPTPQPFPIPVPGFPTPTPFPTPDLPTIPSPPPTLPAPPPEEAKMPFWGPLLVAGAVATATILIARVGRSSSR